MATDKFSIVTTASGAISIRNNVVGEIMHNPVGPWEEANALYVDGSRLRELLTEDLMSELVIYDVGLGAAANALAATRAAQGLGAAWRRPLRLVSFENDLTLLEFTLAQAEKLPYVTGADSALSALLRERRYRSPCGRLTWELHEGDFLMQVARVTVAPEIVFFDPYSPAVNREMWTRDAFARLFGACRGAARPVGVYTYSVATPIRAAMLTAGFFVGHGPATGLKRETTQAGTTRDVLAQPLGERWLLRWLRSHTRHPYDAGPLDADEMTYAVLRHPQFLDLVYRTQMPDPRPHANT